jgi:hypothetical protein
LLHLSIAAHSRSDHSFLTEAANIPSHADEDLIFSAKSISYLHFRWRIDFAVVVTDAAYSPPLSPFKGASLRKTTVF